jgi:hypothetical protein
MNNLGLAIVLAVMLFAGEADAQMLRILGAGAAVCGRWVIDRREDSALAIYEFSWVLGFLTGLNAGLPAESSNDHQVGARLDVDAARVWLDNYCTAHPLDRLAKAAAQLYAYTRSQNE